MVEFFVYELSGSGFDSSCNGIRCLVLFDYGWFHKTCDRIKYLMSEKSGITDSIIIILRKSELIHIILYHLKKYWHSLSQLLIRIKNIYYYNIFWQESSHKNKSNKEYFRMIVSIL